MPARRVLAGLEIELDVSNDPADPAAVVIVLRRGAHAVSERILARDEAAWGRAMFELLCRLDAERGGIDSGPSSMGSLWADEPPTQPV